MKFRNFGAAVLLASIASSSPISKCLTTSVCFAVGIPPSTASAGSGDIYIQLTAPSSGYSWAGLGIGSVMNGATIFVMYADGNGNVTISARSGGEHVMPLFSSSDQAKTVLLAGSGVSNGLMTANFKYSVSSILNVASSSTNWIAAWRTGNSLDSMSTSATIQMHDIGSNAQLVLDLTLATISSDSNPFVSSSSPSGESTPTSVGSGATSTPASSGSGVTVLSNNDVTTYRMAHGIIMASSLVVLFPMGAIIFRLFGGVRLHALIQIFTLCIIIAGFGLGIRLGQLRSELFNTTHTTLGTAVVCLFLLQPLLGLLHHRQYLKIGKRSYFGHAHIWYGRIIIILGIINGGLGLQLAANTTNGEIAYGVVVGAIFILYVAVIVITGLRREREVKSS